MTEWVKVFPSAADTIPKSVTDSTSPTGFGYSHQTKSQLKTFLDVDDLENKAIFDQINVKDYGAVGDGVTDDTEAIQNAINNILSMGGKLIIPQPSVKYLITDTLSFNNDYWDSKPVTVEGEHGRITDLAFDNDTEDKAFIYIDTKIDYLTFNNIHFIDVNARTSLGLHFNGDIASGSPTWKHTFNQCRIENFKTGVKFDGQTSTTNDAYLDGVTFYQSKFRNNVIGAHYKNIQAVNHVYLNTDFENDHADDATEKWTHIYLERGTVITHLGGSVIGYGAYIKYLYPADGTTFQSSSRFTSIGVRLEAKGDGPFISHDTDSNIILSHFLRLSFQDLSVICASYSDPKLALIGGRTLLEFDNCVATVPMDVQCYITSNLVGTGQYGNLIINNSKNILVERVTSENAFGGTSVASSLWQNIPSEITYKNEGTLTTADGSSYLTVNASKSNIYAGGYQSVIPKTIAYAPSTSVGFGNGSDPYTSLVNLPLNARPYKFRVIKDYANVSSEFTLTLQFVINGSDYTVAVISPTVDVAGNFETDISLPSALVRNIVDGTIWDGKMKIIKSGSSNGFLGLIIVEYM